MSATLVDRPRTNGSSFDLFNLPDAYYDDPYPFFRDLRDDDPMHWNTDGSVLLTRYDDVKAVWRDLSGVVNRESMYREKFGEGHSSSITPPRCCFAIRPITIGCVPS